MLVFSWYGLGPHYRERYRKVEGKSWCMGWGRFVRVHTLWSVVHTKVKDRLHCCRLFSKLHINVKSPRKELPSRKLPCPHRNESVRAAPWP